MPALSTISLQGSALGRFACLRISLGSTGVCSFIRTQTGGKCCVLTVFWPFLAGSKWRISSRPQATTVHRSFCAHNVFLQGSYRRRFAESPGSEDSECLTTDPRKLSTPAGAGRFWSTPKCTTFLRANSSYTSGQHHLLSALSATVKASSKQPTPPIDRATLDT